MLSECVSVRVSKCIVSMRWEKGGRERSERGRKGEREQACLVEHALPKCCVGRPQPLKKYLKSGNYHFSFTTPLSKII